MQTVSSSEENVVTAMQDLAIKSPKVQHSPRCARLGWSAFAQPNSRYFQSVDSSSSAAAFIQQEQIVEPTTPMGKRTATSPPVTPKKLKKAK
jgi:hypothetical protein